MDPTAALKTLYAGSVIMAVFTLLLGVAYFTLWLTALVHCINHHHDNDRLMWVLVIIFVPLFGAILYFASGRKKSVSTPSSVSPASNLNQPGSRPVSFHPIPIIPDPSFDDTNLHDEKQRVASINEALRAMGQANRKQK